MEHWNADDLYQIALARHREDVARGEAAQRLTAALGSHLPRARFAATLVALAHRLRPVPSPASADDPTVTPGTLA